MNILYVIETGGPGGAEQAFLTTLLAMRARGHTCVAVTFREGWLTERLDQENVQRHLVPASLSKLASIKEICKLIRNNSIDIIHSHLLDSNFYASISGFFTSTPHFGTEHGDIHHSQMKKFTRLKTKITSLLTRQILSVSDYSKNALLSFGMSSKKVSVLGNPFDFEINPDILIPKSKRARYLKIDSISENDWLWIHVANLRPVKDQSTLLKGFAKACSGTEIKQHLLVVGGGDLEKNLREETKNLNISDKVHFLGFRNDVQSLLSLSDGFILSSLSEATPVSILEAAKYTLLLISSSVGGIPELIKHNHSGYLFQKSSFEDLGGVLLTALSEKEKSIQLANAAHEDLRNRFSLDVICDRLLVYYNDALAKRV